MLCLLYHTSFALCFSFKKRLHTALYNYLTKQTQPPAVKACPEPLPVQPAGHLLPVAGAPDTRPASLQAQQAEAWNGGDACPAQQLLRKAPGLHHHGPSRARGPRPFQRQRPKARVSYGLPSMQGSEVGS